MFGKRGRNHPTRTRKSPVIPSRAYDTSEDGQRRWKVLGVQVNEVGRKASSVSVGKQNSGYVIRIQFVTVTVEIFVITPS